MHHLRSARLALVLAVSISALAGCDCAEPSRVGGVGDPCMGTSDCEADLVCIDNVCRLGPDAGPEPDGGFPDAPRTDTMGTDAPTVDAPSLCEPACSVGQRCDTSDSTP